ncbi:MAG: radical SAM protein [Deltaproteobacteria bacterium]|nr:radical SAM protein [Deltaproteobacteria bacterium]
MTEASVRPFLISWNITKRCNLKCAHCYLDAVELAGKDDISTAEALVFLDKIAIDAPDAMLILTGGEPLLRPDIYDVASYANSKGLTVVLGTNGTLIDREAARRIRESGIKGAGVSVDSIEPSFHDSFRGVKDAWQKTVEGLQYLKDERIDFQIHATVTKENRGRLRRLASFAGETGARGVNFFFLVCTGRGEKMSDITPAEYEEALKEIVELSNEGGVAARARCAPHILRLTGPSSALSTGTSGCIAGKGYLRISPDGLVTPCPYMPVTRQSMSLRDFTIAEIIAGDASFRLLSAPSLKGRCRDCEFAETCGGCRARALSDSGDIMGEDGWCSYEPKPRADLDKSEPVWTGEAIERLAKVPAFLRPMVKKGVERYAKAKGLSEITPDVMAELKSRYRG